MRGNRFVADLERYLDMHLRISWKGRRRWSPLLYIGSFVDLVKFRQLPSRKLFAPRKLGSEFPRSTVAMTGTKKVRRQPSWGDAQEIDRDDSVLPIGEDILEDHIRQWSSSGMVIRIREHDHDVVFGMVVGFGVILGKGMEGFKLLQQLKVWWTISTYYYHTVSYVE